MTKKEDINRFDKTSPNELFHPHHLSYFLKTMEPHYVGSLEFYDHVLRINRKKEIVAEQIK